MRDEGAKNDERAKPGETVSQSRNSGEKGCARAMARVMSATTGSRKKRSRKSNAERMKQTGDER